MGFVIDKESLAESIMEEAGMVWKGGNGGGVIHQAGKSASAPKRQKEGYGDVDATGKMDLKKRYEVG
jgi:hypothetical protein